MQLLTGFDCRIWERSHDKAELLGLVKLAWCFSLPHSKRVGLERKLRVQFEWEREGGGRLEDPADCEEMTVQVGLMNNLVNAVYGELFRNNWSI